VAATLNHSAGRAVSLYEKQAAFTDTSDNIVCIRLIEQFFLRRLYAFSEYNLKRMSAVFQEINLQPQINIPQLSEAACLSSKQFGRVFADHVGTTPKEYLRIVRMQRALFLLQQDVTLPFVQVAYECGYSDQSHMIKEFKLFSGYTPAEYLFRVLLILITSRNFENVFFFLSELCGIPYFCSVFAKAQ